jgi:DNA-3-methyladenine glycosylase
MMTDVMPRSFYDRDAIDVARDLLGKTLVRELNGERLSAMIVETEAYVGPHDLACHASKGMTDRNKVMFGPPGHAYVYFIYGMYYCLNLVTGHDGYPAAVLIRACEPIEGIEAMRRLRTKAKKDRDLTSGPGKLCMAMGIDRASNGADVCTGKTLFVEDAPPAKEIVGCKRIGVDYAGEYKDKPWRFYIKDNPYVSLTVGQAERPRPANKKARSVTV